MLLPALLYVAHSLPVGIDPTALRALVDRAKATHSDALVVMHDGTVVLEEHFGTPDTPIEAMSATKSVVSICIGLLVDEGKIPSVDTPVQHFFPDYKGGGKEKVTVRHLLEHSSGIAANPTTFDIYASGDFVKNALDSEIKTEPGKVFFYNNKAVNLLGGIIGKASGKRMDLYLQEKLFKPLGIEKTGWTLDKVGHPHGMSGLQIRAADFAKIGQLMLDGGMHKGKRLLSKPWVDSSTQVSKVALAASNPCGWLWWPALERQGILIDQATFDAWRKAGIAEADLARLRSMVGKLFPTGVAFSAAFTEAMPKAEERTALQTKLRDLKLPPGKVVLEGKVVCYMANGFLGQYLVVVPEKKIVAVRFRRQGRTTVAGPDDFADFPQIVRDLPVKP